MRNTSTETARTRIWRCALSRTSASHFFTSHAEKRVTKAEPDAAYRRKRRKPAEVTFGILTVRDLQSFHQGADRHPLYKGRDQRSAGKAQIPDPAQPLRLVAKFERNPAQDQAQQHDDERQIECRQQR